MEGALLDGAFEFDDAFENIDGVALTFRSARLSSMEGKRDKRPLFI